MLLHPFFVCAIIANSLKVKLFKSQIILLSKKIVSEACRFTGLNKMEANYELG